MKKIIVVLMFLTVCFIVGSKESLMDNDAILKKINLNIHANWTVKTDNDKIIFERTGEVYSLYENMTNAPVSLETEDERNQRIKKYGQKTGTKIIYRYELKWNDKKILEVKSGNQKIYNQINGLIKKHKIGHLYDEMLSSKDGEFFNEGTEEENKRVKSYYLEKQNLLDKIIKLPDYNTEKYSLFFVEGTGYNDIDRLVYPYSASEEAYEVMNLIKTLCKEIN